MTISGDPSPERRPILEAPATLRTPAYRLGWVLTTVAALVLVLALTSRLHRALFEDVSSRLQAASSLVVDLVVHGRSFEALDPEVAARVERIRQGTNVTTIALYDSQGRLLGGGDVDRGVPSRVHLSESRLGEAVRRTPERDAQGGWALVTTLPGRDGIGGVLVRMNAAATASLTNVSSGILLLKVSLVLASALALVTMVRWALGGAPAPRPRRVQGSAPESDVGVVLGTMRDVVTTLKDSETTYRDRWTEARDSAQWERMTNDLVLESMGSGVIVFDATGRIVRFNSAAQTILAVDAPGIVGRPYGEVFGAWEPLERSIRGVVEREEAVSRVEWERVGAEEASTWLGITTSVVRAKTGQALGGILLVADITEAKRRLEAEGLRDRLSAIGEMSAGIAHEIKNSLHSLLGFANLLQEDAGREPPMAVRGILTEVEQLQSIVQGVLQFSKPSGFVLTEERIEPLLSEVHRAVASEAEAAGVEVRIRTPGDLPSVRGDAQALRGAFVNLARNAIQAISGGGTLTIAAQTADFFPGESGVGRRAVRISFRDTGQGIPDGDRDRIFTPFYTTKRDGHGLGLALVHKTIVDHGGQVDLRSRLGVGTEFVLHLPVEDGSEEAGSLDRGSRNDATNGRGDASATRV